MKTPWDTTSTRRSGRRSTSPTNARARASTESSVSRRAVHSVSSSGKPPMSTGGQNTAASSARVRRLSGRYCPYASRTASTATIGGGFPPPSAACAPDAATAADADAAAPGADASFPPAPPPPPLAITAMAVCSARVRGEVTTSCAPSVWTKGRSACACANPCAVSPGSNSASGGSFAAASGWLCTATACRSRCSALHCMVAAGG